MINDIRKFNNKSSFDKAIMLIAIILALAIIIYARFNSFSTFFGSLKEYNEIKNEITINNDLN